MFAYAALRCPEQADVIARVLAIPPKRPNVTVVSFLTPAETTALLDAPDHATAIGRRDHALLLTAIQTGRRVSELTTLRHTCAMNLLAAGVNLTTIALFLGHSSTRSTEKYIHADLALKAQALARIAPTPTPTPAAARRYRPPDKLLAFLESL